MLQVGFRVRQIAVLTLVAAAVALVTSAVSAALLAQTMVSGARDGAEVLAQALYHQATRALRQHAPEEVWNALSTDVAMRRYVEGVVGYSPTTLYMAITDATDVVVFHNDPRQEGSTLSPAISLRELSSRTAPEQLWALFRATGPLVVDEPFSIEGDRPFGRVYVAVSGLLLKKTLLRTITLNALLASGAVILAFAVSFFLAQRMLAPLEALREPLARIAVADDQPPLDLRNEADVNRVAEFFESLGQRLASDQRIGESGLSIHTLLAGLNDAVVVLAADRRILSANDSAKKLFGPETMPGRLLDELLKDDHPVRELVEDALGQDRTDTIRSVPLAVNGESAEYLLSAHVLREPDRAGGLLITARNMQRISRLASQLSYAQKISSLGRLTSGVAHELRNPLNAMTMHLTILRKKVAAGSPEAGRHVDVLEEELRRLHRVVKGFLDFSRPDQIDLQRVGIEDIIRDSINRVRTLANSRDVRIRFEPDGDLPRIIANFHLMEQAFVNLLTNSCEAMSDGGQIVVHARRRPDGGISATVEDSGPGIPPESLAKVFDLYFTTKPEGSGVGLSLVYRIAQLHGGDVDVQSEPGRGTSITINVPEDSA